MRFGCAYPVCVLRFVDSESLCWLVAASSTNNTNGSDRSDDNASREDANLSDAREAYKGDDGDDTSSGFEQMESRLVGRIGTYLKPYAGWVALALGITFIASMLGPLRPMLIQLAIDQYIVGGSAAPGGLQGWIVAQAEALGPWGVTGLQAIVLFLVAALMTEGVFAFIKNYMTQWIGQRAIYDLRTTVFDFVLRQPLKFFDRTPVGRLITRTTSDVEALSDVLSSGVVVILGDLFRLVFITYFMFTINPTLAIVTLTVMPLMVWVTFWFRNHVRTHYRETRKQISRLNSFIQEHITGMTIVQLFGREDEEMRRFKQINNDHRDAQIQTIFYFAIFWPAVQIIADVAVGAVLWFGGLQAMTSSALTLGVLIAFIQYARQFFEPIRELSNQYNTLQRAMAGAERIFGLLDDDYALEEPDTPVELDALKGRITFEHVWFTYEDLDRVDDPTAHDNVEWILKDVSFTIDPGETAALVGATGAGKSTVMNVLLRFYDIQHGRILVDGVDIRDLKLQDLRRHIGLVLQDVFLFSGTVERNLTLGNDDISEEAIREAVRMVQADRFIDQLPEGFQQDVKERGASLSHGQRQLLAFVRALLYRPDVLVLDEATSSVDTETEALIQSALEALTEDRTTLAVAHRLSTIRDADQILVMHKGEIRERGTHDELLQIDGLYRRLYEMQYREQEPASQKVEA